MSKKGFTLIEIMIVIAIIAILASVVLIGLGPTQRIARDARRLSDLRQVQTGLELYFNKCGYYPGTAQSGASCSARSDITTWDALNDALKGSSIGVNQDIPNDPSSGRTYDYRSDGVTYVLRADLEDTGNQSLQGDVDGNVLGLDCGETTAPYYCLQL